MIMNKGTPMLLERKWCKAMNTGKVKPGFLGGGD